MKHFEKTTFKKIIKSQNVFISIIQIGIPNRQIRVQISRKLSDTQQTNSESKTLLQVARLLAGVEI